MNIQIFGTKKCNDTKKAERFVKPSVKPICKTRITTQPAPFSR